MLFKDELVLDLHYVPLQIAQKRLREVERKMWGSQY